MPRRWSNKFKRSIDCKHPKGFSQRAHCRSRLKSKSRRRRRYRAPKRHDSSQPVGPGVHTEKAPRTQTQTSPSKQGVPARPSSAGLPGSSSDMSQSREQLMTSVVQQVIYHSHASYTADLDSNIRNLVERMLVGIPEWQHVDALNKLLQNPETVIPPLRTQTHTSPSHRPNEEPMSL